ncbi:ABC transporter permease [bacterium]|nr:ABC transporter permease [bacterium]
MRTPVPNDPTTGPARTLGAVALFLALLAVVATVFLHTFPPAPWEPAVPPFDAYNRAPMRTAMDSDRVQRELETWLGFGSRFLGQEGWSRAARHLRDAFAAAGLEQLELVVNTPAPRTLRREIHDPDGRPLPGVAVYPFFPNQFQPMVTPADGISGELVLVDDQVLRQRLRFDDAIALIDAERLPRDFESRWTRYAQVGFRAVIVAHRHGLAAMPWVNSMDMVSPAPVNYVRLAANERIFRHVGQRVTLHVTTAWRNTPNPVLIGVLRAPGQAREAVVITASYDAPSYLPDSAPGALAATPPAALVSLLRGLASYHDLLRRDVIFIAVGSQVLAHDATARLVAGLGPATQPEAARREIEKRLAEHNRQFACWEAIVAGTAGDGFARDPAATAASLAKLSPDQQEALADQVRYVLNTVLIERGEHQLAAHVRFLRAGEPAGGGPEFDAYLQARQAYDRAQVLAGFPLERVVAEQGAFADAVGLADRCRARFAELLSFHARERQAAAAALQIHRLLHGYQRFVVVSPDLVPAETATDRETVGFYMGEQAEWVRYIQHPAINNLLQSVVQKSDLAGPLALEPLAPLGHSAVIAPKISGLMTPVRNWNAVAYVGFALVNTDRARAYSQWGSPVVRPWMRDLASLRYSLAFLGDTVLSLAFGDGRFAPPQMTAPRSFDGRVLVAGVGQSIVPNHPLAGALFGVMPAVTAAAKFGPLGCFRSTMSFTDPYGRYDLPFWTSVFTEAGYSPEAFGFGPDGLIRYAKDQGDLGQSVAQSINLPIWLRPPTDVNLVTFRAAPVSFPDLVNPQTLKSYSGLDFLSREGLVSLIRRNTSLLDGVYTAFLEPDRWFYVALQAGAPENELVLTTRAFVLGTGATSYQEDPHREIDGRGYLTYDQPLLLDLPQKTARSMLSLNRRRLELQERYHMADARAREFQDQGEALLAASQDPSLPHRQRTLLARDAVTYATLNHPVLRRSITEAVVGILWYLGLLVPFVYFLEKLLFGFTDIRRQLATQAVMFLIAFFLLRLLHPAFAMIRSSLMILLGFVILLISAGITILFSGKFQENLEQLRRRRGQVSAAEINTMGVIATAFMLGLNNMHRRRVRTGLTCATLVLMTFAMVCFTSIQSDVVETGAAVGKAPYQGFLVKPEDFRPVTDAELFALQTKYGDDLPVAGRWMYVGVLSGDLRQYNPELQIVHDPGDRPAGKARFDSVVVLQPQEPLRDQVRLLTTNGWFTAAHGAPGVEIGSVMIPDALAARLGVSVAAVNRAPVPVEINGKPFRVFGIFDTGAFDQLRDLDGRPLRPFDMKALRAVRNDVAAQPLAGPDEPLVEVGRLVLMPALPDIYVANGVARLVSVVVVADTLPYKRARELINRFLEQNGQPVHYGLDGVSYLGQRTRAASFAGLIELIIPLVIAALTVLNTMRGSVYERRDEILVYNAVGIAPRFVFFIFFAEAFVYAVVGAVLGYLLSQGTGLFLTKMGWTGGLTMTFTSLNTIFASLAIAAAVFVSTWFPARAAMRIATPADELGWRLPESDGDRLGFDLPFTFDARDRVAVLSFFHRYFVDHGEGSAGKFFTGPPRIGLAPDPDPLTPDTPVPRLQSTIWLKPFDLGVSQQLTITLPTDPETREFIAHISLTRLSGTREAWRRLNRSFVMLLREHFLHWRAVRAPERAEMFAEGKNLLETQPPAEEPSLHG